MSQADHQEIEFVYTDIDVENIRTRLESAGAEFVFDEVWEDATFDYPDFRLNDSGAWIRLRKRGDGAMLAYKQRIGYDHETDGTSEQKADLGMKEIEFEVGDFKTTRDFMHAIGLIDKQRNEKRRIRYVLDGVEFDIDYWPMIKPYLEVEATSEAQIDEAVAKIGLDPIEKRLINYWSIAIEQGVNPKEYKVMTFDEQIKREA